MNLELEVKMTKLNVIVILIKFSILNKNMISSGMNFSFYHLIFYLAVLYIPPHILSGL